LLHSLVHILPAAPLAVLLICFTRRRLACHDARYIAFFFHFLTSCPLRCSLHRLFLSLLVGLAHVPFAGLLVFVHGITTQNMRDIV
jgi:hypothetical protein